MNNVLQFEGDIRMSIIAALGGLVPVNPDPTDPFGNIPVEASANVFTYEAGDERRVQSKRRDRFNQVLYSEQDPGISNLSLTLVAIPPPLLARVFYGEGAEVSVTAGEVEEEPLTVTEKGVPLSLANRYLTAAAVVVTNNAGSTTYVLNTDYTVDRLRGHITIKSGSVIAVDDVLKVTYTNAAYTLLSIRGGVKPNENFYITGDMLNRPGKQDMSLEIYQATLSTDGDFDLFSAEPLTLTLTGPLITPEGKTEPYVAKWFQKAA